MNNKLIHNEWDIFIESKSSLMDINFRDIWRYRDLLLMLVKRDFINYYKQTVFGPVWFFLQPLMTTFIYIIIFGNMAAFSTDGLPQPLFYLAGIIPWNYFADCLIKTSTVFMDNQGIFGKVYFPRIIIPLSIVTSSLIRLGIQLVLFLLFMLYYYFIGGNFEIKLEILLFPYLVLLMAFLGLGIGMIVTSLTTKYRDLTYLVQFGVQLLMFVTTVIYPLSSAPPNYKWLIELNPLTGIIEAIRYGFLGKGYISLESIIYSSISVSVVLVLGVLIFNKTEKNFVDTI